MGDMTSARSVPSVVVGSAAVTIFPPVPTTPTRRYKCFPRQPDGRRLNQHFANFQSLSSSSLPNIHIELEDGHALLHATIPNRVTNSADAFPIPAEAGSQSLGQPRLRPNPSRSITKASSEASSCSQTLRASQVSGNETASSFQARPTVPPKPKFLQQVPKLTHASGLRRRRSTELGSSFPALDSTGLTLSQSLSNRCPPPAAAEVNSILNEIESGLNSLLMGKVSASNSVRKRSEAEEASGDKSDFVIPSVR